MGLENGIMVISKTDNGKYFMESFLPSDIVDDGEWELFYCRKCQNIRNKFKQEFSYNEEKHKIDFTVGDIPHIIEVLKYFLEEDHWEEDGYSIWEWHSMIVLIAKAIHYFYIIMEKGLFEKRIDKEDIHIYMYDSY